MLEDGVQEPLGGQVFGRYGTIQSISVVELHVDKNRLKEFEAIFNPRSVAIVGSSSSTRKPGGFATYNFLHCGYNGRVFPINPVEGEIMGVPAYPSVKDVPEPVDYAVIMIPANMVPKAIDECVAKGVKVAQIFTAGFSETGEEEGIQLQRELVARARRGGLRVIGPNCAGISCPLRRIPIPTGATIGQPGDVAFLSQSGGHVQSMLDMGFSRGLRYSKVAAFGNGSDLNVLDFLEYLRDDPETKSIGLYAEGTPDGRQLYRLLAEISRNKPVVFMKGGKTRAGIEAAASHTGSLAGSETVWAAAMKQAGVIEVNSLEEMVDTLMAFQYLPPLRSNRLLFVSQPGGAAGGASVFAADVFSGLGLELPPFTPEVKERLKAVVNSPGSILGNPLDVSMVGRVPESLRQVMSMLSALPDTDLIVVMQRVTFLLQMMAPADVQAINDALISSRQSKPVLLVSQPGGLREVERQAAEKRFVEAGVPVYPSFHRAGMAIANIVRYWQFRNGTGLGD